MSSALGIIGIILAVAFLIYFAYKGINVILLGVISCLIIMVFNGMPVIKSVNKVMLPGVCTYITAMAGPIPGFIGGAFVLALNITVMNHLAKKEIARGHLYTPQQRELKMTDDSRKPHWLISIIPMTSTIIGYNAFK
ncbi:MAG: hypothetical protein LKK51_03235 [Eubacterium sp.]|nr:hypothetical protein [Eubacterium sp.]MCI2197072.1 hypothetical protein [Eubacterium sp.]